MLLNESNSDLENMYETLNTQGWDLLTQSFELQYEGCNQVIGCATEKDIWLRQGQLIVLEQLLTLKEDVRAQLNEVITGGEEHADL